MKALSIQQPWAWLIVNGYKDVENRDWRCGRLFFREILVHAGKKFDREAYEWIKREFPTIPLPAPDHFELGGVVGKVTITGCVTSSRSPWFFGPFGFTLTGAVPLPFFPVRGRLMFFDVEMPS